MKILLVILNVFFIQNVLSKEYVMKVNQTQADNPGKKNETVRIAVLGDSITEMLGWTTLLADKLDALHGSEATEVGNYGLSGATISDSHTKRRPAYLRYSDSSLWNAAVHSGADVFAIMLGSCDAKIENWDENNGRFETDYRSYIEELKLLDPQPHIYVIAPPPVLPCIDRPRNRGQIYPDIVNHYFPGELNKIANDESVEFIDLFSYMGGNNEDRQKQWCEDPKNDGFHYGAEEMSECVFEYMKINIDGQQMRDKHIVVKKKEGKPGFWEGLKKSMEVSFLNGGYLHLRWLQYVTFSQD